MRIEPLDATDYSAPHPASSRGSAEEYTPGLRMECVTRRRAGTTTSSQMRRCARRCRPCRRSCSACRCVVLPEMPMQAAMTRVRADAHVVGDLDLVVEFDAFVDHGVVEAPRSMVVLAPISTSSPMRTLPICGTLTQSPRRARSRSRRHR